MIPTVHAEDLRGPEVSRTLHAAGALLVHELFDGALLQKMRAEFESRYSKVYEQERPKDALTVGNRRTMITVALEDPFDSPELTNNSTLKPFLTQALGERHVLNSFGVVAALPGADAQHVHRDHPGLFDETLDGVLPAYAITLIVPLVESTADVGPTIVWPGSHRTRKEEALTQDGFPAVGPLGSALLMDYRLVHGGGPNTSSMVRPVLYSVFSRPWFVDEVNFHRQAPLDRRNVQQGLDQSVARSALG